MIDAHHHFWGDPSPVEYPWMTDELAAIRRPFLPRDLRPLLEAAGVERTILVQTRASLEETRWFLELAAESGFVAGVVGWVDLTEPDVEEQIAGLPPGLVGIRHQVHDEPDPAWLLRPDVIRGLRAVAAAGLVYDLLLKPPHLAAGLQVATLLPELSFVIDHLAKPRIAAGRNDPEWERGMAPFASLPNVCCKVSGLVTEADWSAWRPENLAPYVERAVEWFGEERLMFGSDWPVCLLAADYLRVVATARELVPEPMHEKVFAANAARVYGVG